MGLTSPEMLAAAVHDARKEQKLTQSALSTRVGLKQATVSAFENTPGATRLDTLFKILAAAGLELEVRKRGEAASEQWTEEW